MVQVVVEILLHWLTLVDLAVEDHQERVVLQVIHLPLVPLKVIMVDKVLYQVLVEAVAEVVLVL